jgi:hypothetical protein
MTVAVSVSTPDAAPLTAPYRISNKAGHDAATVTIAVSGAGPVYAYKIKRGGSAIINGADVASLGAVCGLAVCGVDGPAAVTPRDFIEHITDADLGGADGDYPMHVYVYRAGAFE